MLRVISQYGFGADIDRAVEQSRARYVEDTYQDRYMQGDEKFEIWGYMGPGRAWRASDDPFGSPGAARRFALKYLNEFKEDGWTELWVSVEGSDGDRYEDIWNAEDELVA